MDFLSLRSCESGEGGARCIRFARISPMAKDHPFQLLFETLGRLPVAHADAVNRQAFEVLSEILAVPLEKTGRCILLRAPRAGHGKTHLLSRIQHQLGASCEFIPLRAAFGCRIDAVSVADDTLRRLCRQLPASGGLTVLDGFARRLFSSALLPLVATGEVPCEDREGALAALRGKPVETFDFHNPEAATAQWALENLEVLGQRLSLELAQRIDLPVGDVSFWVETLFRFASAPLEHAGRIRTLLEISTGRTDDAIGRLEALLGLLTLLTRVVLVADDLEGFSADEAAALRFAAFIGSLRQSVERLDVILSLNQDIWENAFAPRLSGGLADRLAEVVVELAPLTEKEMAALLESRAPGLGAQLLKQIDVSSAGTHARGLIRAAGLAWLKATAMDSEPAVAESLVSPSPSPVEASRAVVPPSESVQILVKPAAGVGNPLCSPSPFTVVPSPKPLMVLAPKKFPATGALVPPPKPPVTEAVPPQESPESTAAPSAGNDRVDELLREFRERYGRGSL